jgi:hypothetical protein
MPGPCLDLGAGARRRHLKCRPAKVLGGVSVRSAPSADVTDLRAREGPSRPRAPGGRDRSGQRAVGVSPWTFRSRANTAQLPPAATSVRAHPGRGGPSLRSERRRCGRTRSTVRSRGAPGVTDARAGDGLPTHTPRADRRRSRARLARRRGCRGVCASGPVRPSGAGRDLPRARTREPPRPSARRRKPPRQANEGPRGPSARRLTPRSATAGRLSYPRFANSCMSSHSASTQAGSTAL